MIREVVELVVLLLALATSFVVELAIMWAIGFKIADAISRKGE